MPSVNDIERLCFLTEHTVQAVIHEGVCVESLSPNIKNKSDSCVKNRDLVCIKKCNYEHNILFLCVTVFLSTL